MKRKVWLSRADACALLQVNGLLEVLKQRAPEGEARANVARILTLQQFREHVRTACFNSEDETDHVLLEISEDMYAVLRALRLCGTKDSKGRNICVPEVFKSAFRGLKKINYWATSDAKTALSIYKVLLEQTGILFGLSRKSATGWTRDYVIAFAGDLFGQWQEAVQKSIFQIAYVTDHVVDLETASAHAAEFVTASCELESALSSAVAWRLLKQNKPAALIGFRKTAGCPAAEEVSTKPNTECQHVAGQHVRLFAARLAESAVMEALSQLKHAASILFANALCTVATTSTCDLRKMRLFWEDNQGRWKYYGNLNKYCSAKPVTPAAGILLRVGLSGSTTWGGGDNTGIQKNLTLKTIELSRLSRAHATENNVWSQEVLMINPSDSNAVFDRAYANSLKPKALAPTQNVCDVKPHLSMIRALLSYWSQRADHKYPPWMKTCLTTELTESSLVDKLDVCTKEVTNLKTKLVSLVQKLNAFADSHENDSSHFHRHIYMVLSDNTVSAVEWKLPLTVDKARYPGLYDFVVWMLCRNRVLKADHVKLEGWYSLNASGQPPVSGSTSTEAL